MTRKTGGSLLLAGMGAAFVSDVLVQKAGERNCVYYRLQSPNAVRTMSIGYKRNHYMSRAAMAFIQTAKEEYRTF